jgi:transposase
MEKITNKDIANYLGKSINTINGWKGKFPELLELTKTGAFCKKNNITIEMIKSCVELQRLAKGEEEKSE